MLTDSPRPFLADFGSEATVAGEAVLGIYDHAAIDALGIMGEGPTLACATADIGSPAYGAAVSVDGIEYTVAAARADGTGWTVLTLSKVA